MATNPDDEFAVQDLFQKIYRNLKLQCHFDTLPWPSMTDFSKQWLDVFFFRESPIPLMRLLSANRKVESLCFGQINRLGAKGYPAFIFERLQKLKFDLKHPVELLNSGSLSLSFSDAKSTTETAPKQSIRKLKESTFNDSKVIQELLADNKPETLGQSSYIELSESGETGDFDRKAEGTDNPLRFLQREARNKKKTGPPKKEYYRCQHIRALKKSIRQLRSGKFPKAAIHKVNVSDSKQTQAWQALNQFYTQHRGELDDICETVQGPLTDGKKKRKRNSMRTAPRSFNNAYCSGFFSSLTVRAYNRLFCTLVYSAGPTEMCAKMKACCCGGEHTKHCETVWERVHQYVRADMLRELGIQLEA